MNITNKDAVAVAIVKRGEEYFTDSLKILSVHSLATGYFLMPGGKRELNEMPPQTAVRETFEETGLQLDINKLNYVWSYIDENGFNVHFYHIEYERSYGIYGNKEPDKHGAVTFYSISDLKKMPHPKSFFTDLLKIEALYA